MLRFFLKIWPAFIPLIIYIIWVKAFKKKPKKDYIDGEFKIVDESVGAFSLRNNAFVFVIFSTLILIIAGLIFIVITTKPIKQISDEPVAAKIIVE